MKVLLIYPAPPRTHWPLGGFRSYWVPTGLASIAGVMRREGHEVHIHVREEQLIKNRFDWPAADAALRDLLREFSPDVVGLSIVTPGLPEARTIAGWAKEIVGPNVLTIAGGPHPSAVPEQTLQECREIDVLVVGEGEETISELLDPIRAATVRERTGDSERGRLVGPLAHTCGSDGVTLDAIAGIAFRQGGKVIRTADRQPPADLDALGEIPYDLLDMDFYTRRNRWLIRWMELRATNIRTSRGCTHRCSFCGGHVVAGLGVRLHSLDHVMSQIEHAVGRWNLEAIHFEDDTLAADPERLKELCGRLCRAGLDKRIVWDCCLRVDQADADLLATMKRAGCIQVEYGFESGSDASLGALGKGATLAANRRAVELTRATGLRIYADIMVGLPGETEADFLATMEFLRWSRPEVVSATKLAPLPGTAVYNRLSPDQREKLNWEGYAYLDHGPAGANLTAMSDERFAQLCREFFRYFIRPQQIKALHRDTAPENVAERKSLRKKFISFVLRHPIRAAKLPC